MNFEKNSVMKKATEPANRQAARIKSRELKSILIRFFIAIALPVLAFPKSQRATKEKSMAEVFMLPSITKKEKTLKRFLQFIETSIVS